MSMLFILLYAGKENMLRTILYYVSLSSRKATQMETKSTAEHMMLATETLKTCKDTA